VAGDPWERRGGGPARCRKGRGADGREGERGRQREKERWGREDERRKKMMLTIGTVIERRMRYTSSYTPAAGPNSSSYVFCGIFE
jgi:hypothetical protein